MGCLCCMHSSAQRDTARKWPHSLPDHSRLSKAPPIIPCLTLSYIKEIIPQEKICKLKKVFSLFAIGISIPWHRLLAIWTVVSASVTLFQTQHPRWQHPTKTSICQPVCWSVRRLPSGCKNNANYLRHIFANKQMRHIFANTPFANWWRQLCKCRAGSCQSVVSQDYICRAKLLHIIWLLCDWQ